MQIADFNPDDFINTREADKALLVKFYINPKQNMRLTKEEGRPVFEDKEYIDIKVAGSRSEGANRPATEADKARFHDHYMAFKNRTEEATDEGTPLSEWPLMSRSMAAELSFFNVKTVEQFALMADTQIQNFMGGYDMRAKARRWLEQAKADKPIYEHDQRLNDLEKQNEELKEALAALVSEMESPDPEKTEQQVKRAKKRAKKLAE